MYHKSKGKGNHFPLSSGRLFIDTPAGLAYTAFIASDIAPLHWFCPHIMFIAIFKRERAGFPVSITPRLRGSGNERSAVIESHDGQRGWKKRTRSQNP